MNKHFALILFIGLLTILPVNAAITTNDAMVNATCVQLNGTNSGAAEQVYFNYGHDLNHGYSSATRNVSKTGNFYATRCDEPTFLPGEIYKFQACGVTSGCGVSKNFTMNVLVPHPEETLSMYGQDFIDNAGEPSWMAAHIWDVYTMTWGSMFMLLLIAFVFMNITIKQKSITISFLLMLISGGLLWTIAPPELTNIAEILMAVALAGLAFWLYKRRR